MPNPVATRTISYDPTGAYFETHGLDAGALGALAPKLEAARSQVVNDDMAMWNGEKDTPEDLQPLDAAFFDLPDRLLAEYREKGATSEVGRILATAERLQAQSDRLVLLGIGGSYMGMRALFEGICHPYHNELSREERGGKPRLYFEGDNVDNDTISGLLDVLSKDSGDGPEDSWSLVCISKSGGTMETSVALDVFLEALKKNCGGDQSKLASRFVPVTGESGKLREFAGSFGCDDIFAVPDGVGGRFSILSAVGLLPAAILGIDIVQLLEGAAQMNAHFRTAPVGENAVLDYVGVSHLLEEQRGLTTRILSVWRKGLEAAGLWYDQLLAESLGKAERGATPLTVLNTRDLHSRGQQHQEGRRDKLITNVVVDSSSREAITLDKRSDYLAGKTVPEILTAAVDGTNQAYRQDDRPTTTLRLERLDESSLGQLFQHLMLATVVEGRLIGINPYGQPGVEAYKVCVRGILGDN